MACTLDVYKNGTVVNGATGAAGAALTATLKTLLDHEDGDGSGHSLVTTAIQNATVDAQSVLGGIVDNTPVSIPIGEDQLLGRLSGGDVTGLTVAQIKTLLGLATSANMILMAAGGWPSTTNGCSAQTQVEYLTNDVDMFHLDFDPSSDEFAQWAVVMPDNYDGGTVTAQFMWTCDGGGASETVEWALQGRSYANNDDIDQAWGAAVSVNDVRLGTNKTHTSDATAAITLAGTPAAGQLAQFRVQRDVSEDNLTVDARLIGVKLVYGIS